jgi:hypothetical protein
MTGAGTTKKLVGGTLGALAVARQVARHAVWYVRYHVDGTTREAGPRRPGRR